MISLAIHAAFTETL